jgi:drug/metabolite transporter (DMT)-like permease
VYLGAGPTALGFVTWTFALQRTSAGRSGALNYLIPVVATGLRWAVLERTPPWPAFVGGVVCLGGVYLARVWKTGQQTSVTRPASSAVSNGETT